MAHEAQAKVVRQYVGTRNEEEQTRGREQQSVDDGPDAMMSPRLREQRPRQRRRRRFSEIGGIHQFSGGDRAQQPQRALFGDRFRDPAYRPIAQPCNPTRASFPVTRGVHRGPPTSADALELLPEEPGLWRRLVLVLVRLLRVQLVAIPSERHEVNYRVIHSIDYARCLRLI
jgi:hypothetical protein